MLRLMAVVAMVGIITGCAGHKQIIDAAKAGIRSDVFQRMERPAPPVPGYADLLIYSSIKTHHEGRFLFENSSHGKPDFLLLFNVDGQAFAMKGEMREEAGSYPGVDHPESGAGVRYTFQEHVRLKPGRHTVTIAIPDDDLAWKGEVILMEGKNEISIAPVYGKASRRRQVGLLRDASFTRRIDSLHVVVNNNGVASEL